MMMMMTMMIMMVVVVVTTMMVVTDHASKTLFSKLPLTELIIHKSNHVIALNSFTEQTLLHGKQENFFLPT
jgi:hypothetical protein